MPRLPSNLNAIIIATVPLKFHYRFVRLAGEYVFSMLTNMLTQDIGTQLTNQGIFYRSTHLQNISNTKHMPNASCCIVYPSVYRF